MGGELTSGEVREGSNLAAAGYDIRVTRRCRVEDLEQEAEGPLESIAGHEIIRALVNKHDATPETTHTVGPSAGDRTLGVLRYGDDHRGAIWLDRANNALWLCAYGLHRSGEPDDSFAYFDELIADGRIYPSGQDRNWLCRDRAKRMVDAIPVEANRFREMIEVAPGTELTRSIGGVRVRAVLVEVSGIRELHVAVSMRGGNINLVLAILAALRPSGEELGDWRPEGALPTSALDGRHIEIAYSCLLE